ncbi:MAG: hypothetical protein ACJ8AT_16550 [Hyalangium sp.]|uniref:hypothetical protein n=1 Tax=Hyalangium sp. TaxID=2028555 RepID=UPI00389B0D11
MATRREVMGELLALLLLPLTGTQALAQAPAQAQKAQQERVAFNGSFGACLGGRGYSVK